MSEEEDAVLAAVLAEAHSLIKETSASVALMNKITNVTSDHIEEGRRVAKDLEDYETRMKKKVTASEPLRAEIDAIDREIGALEGTAESLERYVDGLCKRVKLAVTQKRARASSCSNPADSTAKSRVVSPKDSEMGEGASASSDVPK
eukprot:g1258.t1